MKICVITHDHKDHLQLLGNNSGSKVAYCVGSIQIHIDI